MPGSGNTTIPTPDDGSCSSSTGSPASRVVPALFLAWSQHQPGRAGEVALLDPTRTAPFVVGREDPGDPARVHFFQLRPGVAIDGGPLTGRNISRQQFRFTVEGDALRVRNTSDSTLARVDGVGLPPGASVLLRAGAVLEVPGNCVLLVGRSPLSLPPPPARLLPLHPFGEVDGMGLVGESGRMHQLREDILFAASAGRNVFVHGESGSGKEAVARAIHEHSPRNRGPYVTANCASFTAELAAVELFGNPKGYPNPGTPERVGYFGQARGGTLLLDEMGEVPPAVQAPLLRALDGEYNRVGDSVPRPTGCVVIVATNRDPASIKHDVLHRLGVTVDTPSLAEHREDIPLLVRALLLRRADADPVLASSLVRHDARGRPYVELEASLIVGLLRAPLPGNVREVDNILTMAIAASGGQSALRWPERLSQRPPASPVAHADAVEEGIRETLEGIGTPRLPSKERVLKALEACGGHLRKTAVALGISDDQLYRLRFKYELNRSE